jgi:hypothetical protein
MTRIALNTVKAPAVDSHDGALHIDEIVLAQALAVPFSVPRRRVSGPRRLAKAQSTLLPIIWPATGKMERLLYHSDLTAVSTCFAIAS